MVWTPEIESAQNILNGYYNQSVEDCRAIANQKYTLFVSLAIALATLLYAINLEDALSSKDPISLTIIILALTVIIHNLYYAVFLTFHLTVARKATIEIEKLQRDLLFNDMSNKVTCFKWNDIIREKNKLKDYLRKQFVLTHCIIEPRIEVEMDDSKTSINIKITPSIPDMTIEYIRYLCFKLWKILKSRRIKQDSYGYSIFSEERTINAILSLKKCDNEAVLKSNEVEIDKFQINEVENLDVNKKETNYILSESEFKHRFRNIGPHSAVYRPSYLNGFKSITIIILIILILIVILLLSFIVNI